jgi:nucleoside-diphosphate-sugar epimerase
MTHHEPRSPISGSPAPTRPIRNATVLVLGATGTVGSLVARRLLANGVHVVAHGRDRSRLAQLQAFGASSVQSDIRTGETAPTLLRVASDAIAVVSFLPPEPAVIRAAGRLMGELPGTCRIHLSSSAVYERLRDQYDLTESGMRTSSPFFAAERTLERETQGCVTLIRPGRLYGADALYRPVQAWARSGPLPLIRDGDVETSVLDLEDLADAITHLIGTPAAGRAFGPYNLAAARFPVQYLVGKMFAGQGGRVSWRPASRIGLRVGESARVLFTALDGAGPATVNVAKLLGWSLTLDSSAFRRETGWRPRSENRAGLEPGLNDQF